VNAAPPAVHVGFCATVWFGSGFFVFDSLIGVAAWWTDRERVWFLLGRERWLFPCRFNGTFSAQEPPLFDWLGFSAWVFVLGALLEFFEALFPGHGPGINLVAQLCWLLNAVSYIIDSRYRKKHMPMATAPVRRASSSTGEIEWVAVQDAYTKLEVSEDGHGAMGFSGLVAAEAATSTAPGHDHV
jgi:hypothetical protein